jgi:hypothetical protein
VISERGAELSFTVTQPPEVQAREAWDRPFGVKGEGQPVDVVLPGVHQLEACGSDGVDERVAIADANRGEVDAAMLQRDEGLAVREGQLVDEHVPGGSARPASSSPRGGDSTYWRTPDAMRTSAPLASAVLPVKRRLGASRSTARVRPASTTAGSSQTVHVSPGGNSSTLP